MRRGAHTPEELETLFEDAFVIRDSEVLGELFDDGAVLVAGAGEQARTKDEIARVVTTMWEGDRTYVADPRRILQARGLALVVSERAVNVLCRASDGTWRYAIALLDADHTTPRRAR